MLVNFRFTNYLSFNNLTDFSMVATDLKKHANHRIESESINLLRFATLYGANAAGKSNFIHAMGFSKEVILRGIERTVSFDKFCKINKDNKNLTSDFEYEILINGEIFSYGFKVNLSTKIIYAEWLYKINDDDSVYIFTRELNKDVSEIKLNEEELNLSEKDLLRLEIYLSDLKRNNSVLIITELNTNKRKFNIGDGNSVLNTVFQWFSDKLVVVSPHETVSERGITYHLHKDKGIELARFLKSFGTGIEEICTETVAEKDLYNEIPLPIAKKIIEDFKQEEDKSAKGLLRTSDNIYEFTKKDGEMKIQIVKFKHNMEDVLFSLGEESDGTVRLVDLYDILETEQEKVFVVDEIDRSLHPNLTYKFIETFLKHQKNNQLIVTTHEDRLLNLEMLRRDEIWFVEKNSQGETELYSLAGFSDKFDKDVLKAYLDGRYGSVPKFQFLKL